MTGVGARKADLADAGWGIMQMARAGVLAVGVALRAPTLHDERSLGRSRCSAASERMVSAGNLRDFSSPFGGLFHHVVTGSHDVVLIGLVLALGRFGHGVLVVADAVRVQELLVHLVVRRSARARWQLSERGVGARADGQPLVRMCPSVALVQAVVDVHDLAATTLNGLAHASRSPRRCSRRPCAYPPGCCRTSPPGRTSPPPPVIDEA